MLRLFLTVPLVPPNHLKRGCDKQRSIVTVVSPNKGSYLCSVCFILFFLQWHSRYLLCCFISWSSLVNQGTLWNLQPEKVYMEVIWSKAPVTYLFQGATMPLGELCTSVSEKNHRLPVKPHWVNPSRFPEMKTTLIFPPVFSFCFSLLFSSYIL